MNIGGRIAQRLTALGWERKELLSRVPDLTPQALSNLITRDSKRSEWDEAIAQALGVSVLWLVYNYDEQDLGEKGPLTVAFSNDEQALLEGFRIADPSLKRAMLALAREAQAAFEKRNEQRN